MSRRNIFIGVFIFIGILLTLFLVEFIRTRSAMTSGENQNVKVEKINSDSPTK